MRPTRLYSAEQAQHIDNYLIEQTEIPLMENAGSAAWHCLRKNWPNAQKVAVICGKGNNAGDGYVLAALAAKAGVSVQIYSVVDFNQLSPESYTMYQHARQSGAKCEVVENWLTPTFLAPFDVLVDALLGIGFQGELSEHFCQVISAMNCFGQDILAIDIPSGLNANTGLASQVVVEAKQTITFIVPKQGCFLQDGPDCCGEITLEDCGVDAALYAHLLPQLEVFNEETLSTLLPVRSRCAHKGDFGHVVIVGGEEGLSGAVVLAGMAAMRVGAGRVTLATHPTHANSVNTVCPELMTVAIFEPADLMLFLSEAQAVVLGPGLRAGTVWSDKLIATVLNEVSCPLILDAGALRYIAQHNFALGNNAILTPHPGEAASLLSSTPAIIQADRVKSVELLAEKYTGTVVLKGAGTLIKSAQSVATICLAGNPGMATAGMGDVLSGVISGLCAQGMGVSQAAMSGVVLHATAGDRAAEKGMVGLVASDLLVFLRELVN